MKEFRNNSGVGIKHTFAFYSIKMDKLLEHICKNYSIIDFLFPAVHFRSQNAE